MRLRLAPRPTVPAPAQAHADRPALLGRIRARNGVLGELSRHVQWFLRDAGLGSVV